MSVTFHLYLPEYLRLWLIHSMGGEVPVRFPKGSAFSKLLRVFVRNKRESEAYNPPSPESVEIVIPHFPFKDPNYFNYLPLSAQACLQELIRDAFDVELFKDLSSFENVSRRKSNNIIASWMEEHGIEVSDKNWNSVAKRLQILKSHAADRDRKKRSYYQRKSKVSTDV